MNGTFEFKHGNKTFTFHGENDDVQKTIDAIKDANNPLDPEEGEYNVTIGGDGKPVLDPVEEEDTDDSPKGWSRGRKAVAVLALMLLLVALGLKLGWVDMPSLPQMPWQSMEGSLASVNGEHAETAPVADPASQPTSAPSAPVVGSPQPSSAPAPAASAPAAAPAMVDASTLFEGIGFTIDRSGFVTIEGVVNSSGSAQRLRRVHVIDADGDTPGWYGCMTASNRPLHCYNQLQDSDTDVVNNLMSQRRAAAPAPAAATRARFPAAPSATPAPIAATPAPAPAPSETRVSVGTPPTGGTPAVAIPEGVTLHDGEGDATIAALLTDLQRGSDEEREEFAGIPAGEYTVIRQENGTLALAGRGS